jgi:hypothetical protein
VTRRAIVVGDGARNDAAGLVPGILAGALPATALGLLALLNARDLEAAIGGGLRATARWSFVLCLVAYSTGALVRGLAPDADGARARAAALDRRLFAAFASAHIVHLGLIVCLFTLTESPFELAALAGAVGYVLLLPTFVLVLAPDSAIAPARRAVAIRVTLHVSWVLFVASYAGKTTEGQAYAGVLLLAALTALAVRLIAPRRLVGRVGIT